MKQIVLQEPGTFASRSAAEPSRLPGHALVRMACVGLCGSDYHAFAGTQPIYTYPRILGHELSAVIAEPPDSDSSLKRGDRVAIEPYLSCGECYACKRNRPNCCENIQVLGIHVDGGMQEYLSVPASALHKSESLKLEQLALVETLGIGAHAVHRSGLRSGETALIVGAGPIGLAVAQFANAVGAGVRALEPNSARAAFARKFVSDVLPQWDGPAADVVFDATGNARAMEQSLNFVAPGGRLVFVGLCSEKIAIDDPIFHKREITLLASRNSAHQFPRIIRMIETGEIDTSSWIGERLALEEVPEKFAALRARPELVKAVVHVSEA